MIRKQCSARTVCCKKWEKPTAQIKVTHKGLKPGHTPRSLRHHCTVIYCPLVVLHDITTTESTAETVATHWTKCEQNKNDIQVVHKHN